MDTLKSDDTPYKVFTPFYKNLMPLWDSDTINEYTPALNLKLISYPFSDMPPLESLGFDEQILPTFLLQSSSELIKEFSLKLENISGNLNQSKICQKIGWEKVTNCVLIVPFKLSCA